MSRSSGSHPTADSPADMIGTVIAGKYRLRRLLGSGGFSRVYLAQHSSIDSLRFAVKLLRREYVGDWQVLQRFQGEAQAIARLKSRHTVKVYDFGETGSGDQFIVMELVDGQTLTSLLRRPQPLRLRDIHAIAIGVMRSLVEAHRAGIIHRDLKPANIMVTRDPDTAQILARVLDFGIAKIWKNVPGDVDLTHHSESSNPCTPRYAAPELLTGNATPKSDLYAFGLILAELVDGVSPFHGLSPYVAGQAQLSDEPVSIGERCRASVLGPIVAKAVQKKESDRFDSAQELLDALVTAGSGLPDEPDLSALRLRSLDSMPPPRIRTGPGSSLDTLRDPTEPTDIHGFLNKRVPLEEAASLRFEKEVWDNAVAQAGGDAQAAAPNTRLHFALATIVTLGALAGTLIIAASDDGAEPLLPAPIEEPVDAPPNPDPVDGIPQSD